MVLFTLLAVLAVSTPMKGQDAANLEPITYDAILDVKLDEVWDAVSTAKGWESWAVAHAQVDLRNGGTIRTSYRKNAIIGDDSTIENTIMCYDPKRMLAFRVTRYPKGFPFPNAVQSMWSVIYLERVSDSKTKVLERTMGFSSDEESQKMRAFFVRGNKTSMDALAASFAKKK